jgi:hypothetical protein
MLKTDPLALSVQLQAPRLKNDAASNGNVPVNCNGAAPPALTT